MLQDNDPLATAEGLMNVEFRDNDLGPVDKVENLEKAFVIGKNAKGKLQSQVASAEKEVEVACDFD